jgi:hypothetical protein
MQGRRQGVTMKSLLALSLAILALSFCPAQPLCDFLGKDSVFAVIAGDTIVVWDIAACAYCSAAFRVGVTAGADTICIVQTDTAGRIATCDCLFDLRTSISGLPSGTYRVVIERDLLKQYGYPSDLHQFIGSVQVNYGSAGSPGLSYSTFQSGCQPSSVPFGRRADPGQFVLYQNYPNPFNPSTTVRFQTPRWEFVVIRLYDLLGQEVQTLWAERTSPGSHERTIELSPHASSGTYLCRMDAGSFSRTVVMVLLR